MVTLTSHGYEVCALAAPSLPVSALSGAVLTSPRPVVEADRQLADRCLSGDADAWEQIYVQFHDGLLASIRLMFGPTKPDQNQVDEIAARVWYRIIADGGKRLKEFDTARDCRLSTYLAVLARSEAGEMFRSERRRRIREKVASRPNTDLGDTVSSWTEVELHEFLCGLTPRETEFLSSFLLTPHMREEEMEQCYTDTNRWQLTSRVFRKLCEFLDEDGVE